jgi:crotonobetainyl-CoA:carnitine CoA-transferase CaiB-like acyl-CoA transferase
MDGSGKLPLMLSDVRVLDFSQYLAGPAVTRLMAEMGAHIIKVEQAPAGDPSRMLPFVKEGRSAYFVQQNRGKKSLCLDFAKPESMAILRALVPTVDVAVENYGPGVMEKWGFDYESLRGLNPRIVMVSVSAFGRRGPLSHRVGYDYIAQAFSGLMHITGNPDGPPQVVGLPIADQTSAVHALAALGCALYYRTRTGIGQHIDISMVDSLYHLNDINVQVHTMSGGQFIPGRMGSHHTLVCPFGVFKGPQGWIVLCVLDRQWPYMVRAMGRPELSEDPRFASGANRAKHQKELVPIIERWMQSFASDEAVLRVLEENRVPSAPVLTIVDTLSHPYFKAREMVRTVADPLLGEVTIPGFPLKFSAFPELPDIQAPLLGEHGREVLQESLAYGEAQIAELQAKGVLISEKR